MKVFLAFGSNIGKRIEQIREADHRLGLNGIHRLAFSSFYESCPVEVEDQPDFVNAVGCYETLLSPFELLRCLQQVEVEMGRTRDAYKGPRTIDIDVLFYGNWVIETCHLKIPHPAFHLREFVLRPLWEVEPDLVPPTMQGRDVEDLLTFCPDQMSRPVCLDSPSIQ